MISKSSSDNDEANNPEPAKATTKHSSRVAKNETRRAEHVSDEDLSGAPPVPRGATRARYLGTTPGGDLIFGLPSNERGFVAPPKLSRAERRRARRAQQVGDAPAAERALPAEPIGPDDR